MGPLMTSHHMLRHLRGMCNKLATDAACVLKLLTRRPLATEGLHSRGLYHLSEVRPVHWSSESVRFILSEQ